jgi:hypothetical protein
MDFEQELAKLANDGLLVAHCLDFFGQPFDGNPFLAAAIEQCDHGNGDVDFDVEPVVSRTKSGAFVSAWVWVEDYDRSCTPYEKKSLSDFRSALEDLVLRGLTVRACLDYFGKQCAGNPYIERAKELYLYVCPGLRWHPWDKYVFDEFPIVSESVHGAYVSVWLWVSNEEVLPEDDPMNYNPELPDRRILSQCIVDEFRCQHTVDFFAPTPRTHFDTLSHDVCCPWENCVKRGPISQLWLGNRLKGTPSSAPVCRESTEYQRERNRAVVSAG